jgi:hypothetical protein
MLELRSFQSLRGRINRNITAHVVDTVCKTCVGSGAIVAASEVAVEMSSSETMLLSILCEVIPRDEMAD